MDPLRELRLQAQTRKARYGKERIQRLLKNIAILKEEKSLCFEKYRDLYNECTQKLTDAQGLHLFCIEIYNQQNKKIQDYLALIAFLVEEFDEPAKKLMNIILKQIDEQFISFPEI